MRRRSTARCGALALLVVSVGCGGSDGAGAPAAPPDRTRPACERPPAAVEGPDVTAGPTTTDPRPEPLPAVEVDPGGRTPVPGFGEVSAEVVDRPGSGPPLPLCLMVAETARQRSRGLMGVVDPTLGGYDGMVFLHDEVQPAGQGYWMRDTPLPLSLAYLDEDGRVVDTAELDPCPPGAATCPMYPSSGDFTMVIEVVRGGLAPLGLVDGSPARLRLLP